MNVSHIKPQRAHLIAKIIRRRVNKGEANPKLNKQKEKEFYTESSRGRYRLRKVP